MEVISKLTEFHGSLLIVYEKEKKVLLQAEIQKIYALSRISSHVPY